MSQVDDKLSRGEPRAQCPLPIHRHVVGSIGILLVLSGCASEGADSTTVPGTTAASADSGGGSTTTPSGDVGGVPAGDSRSGAIGGSTSASRRTTGTGGLVLNQGGSAPSEAALGGRSEEVSDTDTDTAGGTTAGGTRVKPSSRSVGGSQSGGSATSSKVGDGGSATGGSSSKGSSRGGVASGGSVAGGSSGKGSSTGGAATGGAGTTPLCPNANQTITVAADGSGHFKTVQSAINSIPSNNAKQVQVSVKAGTYNEQVTVNKPFVCLTGASATSTIITHTIDTNIVTGGTVLLTGNDFSAANITFQNSAPAESAQRVALMAKGLRQQFYNCRFVSYQDTLYTNTGTQYFRDCYIQGNTDFIFGDATAVFDNCTIHSVTQGTAVTAPRTPQGTTYGFVFLGGSLTATAAVGTGRVHLGRPWGPYAAAAFINVELGSHIVAAGWTTMSNNTLANTRFWEYQSTGAGANTTNATRSVRQLTSQQAANYTTKNVLSPWVPGYSQ